MLFEKIIFTILAIYLLIVMLFKLIKKVDQIYIPIVIMQALGLIAKIIEIIFLLNFPIIIKVILYIISIIIPLAILILEHKGKNFAELFYQTLAKFYELTRKYKKMQRNVAFTCR